MGTNGGIIPACAGTNADPADVPALPSVNSAEALASASSDKLLRTAVAGGAARDDDPVWRR